MNMNMPQDIKEMTERSSNVKAVMGRIWPPLEESAKADELYGTLRKEGNEIDKQEIIDVFKELEKKGYGDYIVGRRGWSTRIEWNEKAHSLSREEHSSSQEESIAKAIEHKFVLRPGFEVSLALPEDLSLREAERLSNFVKTLPFDSEKG